MKILRKQNVGALDRCFRICMGIVLAALGALIVKGTMGAILMILSIPFLVSGITGFCSIYALLGISTKQES
jgi:uncharacterized membrane protein